MIARRSVAAPLVSLAVLLGVVAPVAADHIGGALTLCGQVLDYAAPTAVVDGSLSMNGVSDPDPHPFVIAAGASITAGDSALLTTMAAGDNFTCLAATGDGMAELTAVAIAPSATLCGPVSRSASSDFVVTDEGFEDQRTTLTAEAAALIAANPGLDELLGAFADFGEQPACVAFTTGADGVVDSLQLSGVATSCGALEDTSTHPDTFIWELSGSTWIPAPTVSLSGLTVDSSTFSRTALAALEFTWFTSGTEPIDTCFVLDIVASEIVPAMSRMTAIDTAFIQADATEVEGDGLWLIRVNQSPPGAPVRMLAPPEIREGVNLEQMILFSMGGNTPDFLAHGSSLHIRYSDVGTSQETLLVSVDGIVTFEVVSRSAAQLVLRRVSDGVVFSFVITEGSDVPPCMQPGYRSAGEVDAFNDGRIFFAPFAACPVPGGGGGGGLPDTATGGSQVPVVPLVGVGIIGLAVAIGSRRRLRVTRADI